MASVKQQNFSLDTALVEAETTMYSIGSYNLVPFFDETKAQEEMESSNLAFDSMVRTRKGEEKTVMKVLLEDTNDGHKIVGKELDKMVEKEGPLVGLKVDNGKLFEKDSNIQIQMVQDILDVRKEKDVDSFAFKALTGLIEHPVISSFIVEKWRHTKLLFHIHIRTYMCFLGVFCFFVLNEVNKGIIKYAYEQNVTTVKDVVETKNGTGCPYVEPKVFYKDKSSVLHSVILFIFVMVIVSQIIKMIKTFKKKDMLEFRIKCVNLGCLLLISFVCVVAIYVDRQPMALCISSFLSGWDNGFILIELLFFIFTTIFTLRKILFLVAFRDWTGAVKNHKEILEYLALLGAFTIMAYKGQLKKEKVAAGLTALGVCAAWAVFVIKMGEPRFTMFGNFITMFYNIVKRTTRYLLAILFLITGFAFAFYVLQAGMEIAEEDFHFNIWNMEMSSIVMSTGEFDFGDFFGAFDEEHSKIIVLFAMILLFLMILFITITMLNLLQAVIIQDYNGLMKDVFVQNLIFMCNYIHNMETLVHNAKGYSYIFKNLCPWVENSLKLHQAEIFYCPYQLCSKACPPETHIEPHFNQIILGFNQILEYKTEQKDKINLDSMAKIKRKTEEEIKNIHEEVEDIKNDLKLILAILQSKKSESPSK